MTKKEMHEIYDKAIIDNIEKWVDMMAERDEIKGTNDLPKVMEIKRLVYDLYGYEAGTIQ